MIPLSDNPAHLRHLCLLLDLGEPRGEPRGVSGGFHHRMWRLETDRGVYAIKQLAPDTNLADPDTVTHFNRSESIAEAFSRRGVATISALRQRGNYLQIVAGAGYLVYPWSDALALEKDQISQRHAFAIAALLARMHRADISGSPREILPLLHPVDQLIALAREAEQRGMPYAGALATHLPDFLAILEAQAAARHTLEQHTVISHGDLDQKNVLWDTSGNPVLIDWESARRLNPVYEVLLEALDWGGITSRFDRQLFEGIIDAYRAAGGEIAGQFVDAAFHCILGEWLSWMMYNVGRTVFLEDEQQRVLGTEQIDLTMATILRLQRLMPQLRASTRAHAG